MPNESQLTFTDHTRLVLDESAWSALVDLLNRPASDPDGLRELLATDSVFD